MSSDPNERPPSSDISPPTPTDQRAEVSPQPPSQPADAAESSPDAPEKPAQSSPDVAEKPAESSSQRPRRRQRILIGSQRDPAAYRPQPSRDRIPVVDDTLGKETKPRPEVEAAEESPPSAQAEESPQPSQPEEPPAAAEPSRPGEVPLAEVPPQRSDVAQPSDIGQPAQAAEPQAAAVPGKRFPPPNIRDRLPADLEAELEAALAGSSLDELINQDQAATQQAALEPKSKLTGQIVMIRREDVFVELGGREQGIVPLKHFAQTPQLESQVEVVVTRLNSEEGLYELTLPHAAADVGDWYDLEEGMVVEARVTGHNSGGLECEVNHLRGFIPISQISLYRVEDLAQFLDEKFHCLVTEANPQRRNLVLSRRAILEREREEKRQQLLASLAPGQIYQGVVRKLMDFGAFVDIGGVDGLLHVSQLAWGRVSHPREVLSEGQTIKVRIDKFDADTGRISLAYRDMLENPWDNVQSKFPPNTQVEGKVTKLMEFGAFVELEPGVEGLVHISELSHKRVWRVSDVVQEGQQIDVLIKSVDTAAQRIGLSIKDLMPEPERAKDKSSDDEPGPAAGKTHRQPAGPLQGGLGRSAGGEKFGLKW